MIRLGDDRHFEVVREFLRSNYAEDPGDIADRVGDFLPEKHNDEPALIRMLFLGRAISPEDWESVAPASVRESFDELGLTEPASNGRVRASCLLYMVRGSYVTSDRFMTDEGQVGRPEPDSVYYALTETAQHYLWSLPMDGSDRALDLGSGSGVAALVLANGYQEVYATDIAPRCILFTEFNRRLNGYTNIVVREGSFYEPVEGLQFDLVTCHPPFDLSLSSKKYVYADGGSDGEFVSRGVVAGLPKALKRGGQYVSAFRATDREGAPIHTRIREWLGPEHEEFDIAVAERSTVKPEEHAISASMLAKQNLDEYQSYMDFFKELGVTQFVYCHLLIERKTTSGPPITVRRNVGQRCTAVELRDLLNWERSKDSLNLTRAKLTVSSHMSLHVRHALQKGELLPAEYKFEVSQPFYDQQPVPEWVAKLAALCVAGRTADEVHTLMRKEYPIGREDFDAAVKRLLSMGVLQLASGKSTISSI